MHTLFLCMLSFALGTAAGLIAGVTGLSLYIHLGEEQKDAGDV